MQNPKKMKLKHILLVPLVGVLGLATLFFFGINGTPFNLLFGILLIVMTPILLIEYVSTSKEEKNEKD